MREKRRAALRLVVLTAAALAAAALVACGGDSGGGSGDGSGDGSEFTSAGFQDALDAVSEKEGSSDFGLLKIQITTGGTQFQIRDGEQAHGYLYTPGGDLQDAEVQIIGSGSLEGQDFPFADVDSAAVDEIVSSVEQKVGADDAKVTVMTLEKGITDGVLRWTVNAEGGGRTGLVYTADPDGSNVSNPVDEALGQVEGASKQAQKGLDVAQCIQDAAGDVQKIQDCTQ